MSTATSRRILILHASCGAGHQRAADAIAKAIREERGAEVLVLDALDYVTPRYRSFYLKSYEASVRSAPRLYGAAFRSTSAAVRLPPVRWVRRVFNRLAARRLVPAVRAFDPDVVVCTHFLPLNVLAFARRRGSVSPRMRLACVVTDYVAHGFWAEPLADRYYIPSDDVRRELVRRGVAPSKVRETGIPIDAACVRTPNRNEARRELGLDGMAKVVLVLGGGFGMGPVADVVESIARSAAGPSAGTPVETIAVCGKNGALRARLEALRLPGVRVLGFVSNVPTLMAAADLVVTKPGGLTTTEALALGRPLALFNAMPGQEEGNARYLARAGAAIRIEDPAEAGAAVASLLDRPESLQALALSATRIARPDAAAAIARGALELARDGAERRPAAPVARAA